MYNQYLVNSKQTLFDKQNSEWNYTQKSELNYTQKSEWNYYKYLHPQLYRFRKEPVPENSEEKLKMVERLMKFGVSITQYEKAYNMPDITM